MVSETQLARPRFSIEDSVLVFRVKQWLVKSFFFTFLINMFKSD